VAWRIGDFGRFNAESDKYPRFEVIASDKVKGEVTVWYSGQKKKTVIPRETFLEDCANWWTISSVKPLPIAWPEWLTEGQTFTISGWHRSIPVVITEFKHLYHTTTEAVDVKGRILVYRRRQMNYISCTTTQEPAILLLIPVEMALGHARPTRTRWDLIRTRNVIDLEEDLDL
jgi:hypothetical protein